jgi:XTP/dITP diphosphohydrolase
MNPILLSSNNAHKREEIAAVVRSLGAQVELFQPRDLDVVFDVEETADTFAGNAAVKANALSLAIRGHLIPQATVSVPLETLVQRVREAFNGDVPMVLADDSGICVHAMNNDPGVYSARFGSTPGGPPLSADERNRLLISRMQNVEDRALHYVCNAYLSIDTERWVQAEETWHGQLLTEPASGDTGFGYDPVVYLPDYRCSVSQLPQAQKDRISHRAKAVRAVLRASGIV